MSYISENIFENNQVNIIADKLVYFLLETFNSDYVDSEWCLTGSSGYILQDIESGEASNVIFATSNQNMFDYLIKNISELVQPKNIIKYQERILLDFDYVKIEVWKFSEAITIFSYGSSSIKLQEKTSIPENLL